MKEVITEGWNVFEVYCYEYPDYTTNILAHDEKEAEDIFKQSMDDEGLDTNFELHFRVSSICCDVYRRG